MVGTLAAFQLLMSFGNLSPPIPKYVHIPGGTLGGRSLDSLKKVSGEKLDGLVASANNLLCALFLILQSHSLNHRPSHHPSLLSRHHWHPLF